MLGGKREGGKDTRRSLDLLLTGWGKGPSPDDNKGTRRKGGKNGRGGARGAIHLSVERVSGEGGFSRMKRRRGEGVKKVINHHPSSSITDLPRRSLFCLPQAMEEGRGKGNGGKPPRKELSGMQSRTAGKKVRDHECGRGRKGKREKRSGNLDHRREGNAFSPSEEKKENVNSRGNGGVPTQISTSWLEK